MRLGLVLKYISDNVREGGGGRWNQGAKVIVVESERQGYMFIKLLSLTQGLKLFKIKKKYTFLHDY